MYTREVSIKCENGKTEIIGWRLDGIDNTTSEHMEIYLKQEVYLNGCHFYPEGKTRIVIS